MKESIDVSGERILADQRILEELVNILQKDVEAVLDELSASADQKRLDGLREDRYEAERILEEMKALAEAMRLSGEEIRKCQMECMDAVSLSWI